MSAPVTITLYGPDDEVLATYSRSIVPWGLLKRAWRVSNKMQGSAEMSEEIFDELSGLVVELFGDKFTAAELSKGTDMGEVLAILQEIIARAERVMPKVNPMTPGP